MPLLPVYLAKAGGFFFLVFGVIAVIAAIATINPIWAIRPLPAGPGLHRCPARLVHGLRRGSDPGHAGLGDQLLGPHARPGRAHPAGHLPALSWSLIAVYPFIESWVTGDKREHHLLDRPRNGPTRTALGVAWISWLPGPADRRWKRHRARPTSTCRSTPSPGSSASRFFVVPVVAFIVTKRICLGLQRRDRDKVLHGRETGIIKRLPHGEFVEVHEPLGQEQLHTLTAHEQYAAGRDRCRGRRERCRPQGHAPREAARQAQQGLSTARTARSPSRPSRSTRRSPAATATTDHFASPHHGRRAPVRSSDGGPSPCSELDRVGLTFFSVSSTTPRSGYERCDPRWRRHRGGPFLARRAERAAVRARPGRRCHVLGDGPDHAR